jgi:la-related protein 1
MWAKGQQDQQIPGIETNRNEPYTSLHARAIRARQNDAPGELNHDMKVMYNFWAHFLVRNFNPRMYEEFRRYASEDAARQSMTGVNLLATYYDEILNSKKRTIPEVFAKHYVELVKGEDPTKERFGFTKLRLAWRNGALDMKSRKKISDFIDADLKEELER